MKAADLILNPNRATLAELIDKHNILVRHIFSDPTAAVAPVAPVVRVEDIRNVNTLLLLWGYRCNCVFPQIKQPYADLFICLTCHKPYTEPLSDDGYASKTTPHS